MNNNNNNFDRLDHSQTNTEDFQKSVIEGSFEYKSEETSSQIKTGVDNAISSNKNNKDNPQVVYYNPGYEYTPEEISEIDRVMKYVNKIDYILSIKEKFSNSMDYNKFVLSYTSMSDRVKNHFEEIYHDLRVRYLVEKIDNNLKLKNDPKHSLLHYIEELLDIEPDFDYSYFYNKYEYAEEGISIVFDRLSKK